MSEDDNDRKRVTRYESNLPAPVTPSPKIPSLPSSSGAFWGSSTTIAKKDARFLEAHTGLLIAKRDQADAMTSLIESRQAAALAVARLVALPELAEHQYQHGRAERQGEKADWQHAARITDLTHQTLEVGAQAALVRAQQTLTALQPKPPEPAPAPPPPAPPPELSPADVEKVAQNMPELKPDTIQSLMWALNGLLAEKSK